MGGLFSLKYPENNKTEILGEIPIGELSCDITQMCGDKNGNLILLQGWKIVVCDKHLNVIKEWCIPEPYNKQFPVTWLPDDKKAGYEQMVNGYTMFLEDENLIIINTYVKEHQYLSIPYEVILA